MKKLQVLVATMHQKDLSLVEKMNIRCDAVIANQADKNEILTEDNVTMITTKTRGVGLNRNIALLAADAEILLFADITYHSWIFALMASEIKEYSKCISSSC